MVKSVSQDEKQVYQCEVCGFHYKKEETAKQCEAWCTKQNSCNFEITKNALENRANN